MNRNSNITPLFSAFLAFLLAPLLAGNVLAGHRVADMPGTRAAAVSLNDTRKTDNVGAYPGAPAFVSGEKAALESLRPKKIVKKTAIVWPAFVVNARFVAGPEGGACIGETVVFTDSSTTTSRNIVSWEWNFGAGAEPATSTRRGPHEVSWNTPGEKIITLTVTDSRGDTDTFTMTYVVNTPPAQPGIVADPAGVAEPVPVTVNFTPQGGADPDLVYTWVVNDLVNGPVTYQGPSINHVFQMAGEYDVRLIATNGFCSTEDTLVVTADGGPGTVSADFTATPENPCLAEPVVFQMESDSNVVSYRWEFGEGASPAFANTAGPHEVFYSTPGPKIARLTVSNGAVEVTREIALEVTATPQASIAYTGNTADIPANINFESGLTIDPSLDYQWNFGNPQDTTGSNTDSGPTASYEYANAGLYHVSLTVTTPGGCTQTVFDSIRIEGGVDTLQADFAVVTSTRTCVNNTITVTDMSRGYDGNTRQWFFDEEDGAVIDDTTNTSSPVESPGPVDAYWSTPGLKRVTLVVLGQDDTQTKVYSELVQVFPYPNADFNFSGSTCEAPASLTFAAERAPGNYYEWDFGDGSPTVNASEVTHTYNTEGEYTVTLSVVRNGCRSVASRNITVGECEQPPAAGIVVRQARQDCGSQRYIVESAARGTITDWQWEFGAGAQPGSASGPGPHEFTLLPDAQRPIEVTLTTTDQDGNTSTVTVQIP